MTKKAIQVADLEFQDMRNNERVVLEILMFGVRLVLLGG